MPDPFIGGPLLNDSSSSSSGSTLPDQSSCHLTTILSQVQEILDEIKIKLNDPSCTSAQADELSDQISELDSKIHKDSKTSSTEWLNFLRELSIMIVNAIETKSYNEPILLSLINELEVNVNGADDINKSLVPIASAAAKTGNMKILEKIKGVTHIDAFSLVVSTFNLSIEPLRQAILHTQAEAVTYLVKHHQYSLFDIHSCLFELYAKGVGAERINDMLTCLNLTDIEKLEAKEKQLQDANFSSLVERIEKMEAEITALKTENTKLRSQLLAEGDTSPSRTGYSVFGATSSSTSSASGDAQSRSSLKRSDRQDKADNTDIKVKVSRSLSP